MNTVKTGDKVILQRSVKAQNKVELEVLGVTEKGDKILVNGKDGNTVWVGVNCIKEVLPVEFAEENQTEQLEQMDFWVDEDYVQIFQDNRFGAITDGMTKAFFDWEDELKTALFKCSPRLRSLLCFGIGRTRRKGMRDC